METLFIHGGFLKRVLSGIQPSGDLHLGNYFGMMSRMIDYQENNDLFCFIVNCQFYSEISIGTLLTLYLCLTPIKMSTTTVRAYGIINTNLESNSYTP